MIFFERLGITGFIDEYGFVRWDDMGFFLDCIQPGRILTDAIANALLNSSEIDKIITNWFDLSYGYECHD